jgi:hypothetical protein
VKPTPAQIADAIAHVNAARREAWPPADELGDADIPPMKLMAWLVTWEKARQGWIETCADLAAKIPLFADAQEMADGVNELAAAMQASAHEMRLEMMALLDE